MLTDTIAYQILFSQEAPTILVVGLLDKRWCQHFRNKKKKLDFFLLKYLSLIELGCWWSEKHTTMQIKQTQKCPEKCKNELEISNNYLKKN